MGQVFSFESRAGGFPARPAYVEAAAREARAFARLATLLYLDLADVVPTGLRDGDQVVVLVHGALATAGAWRPLRERLAAAGIQSGSFTYKPNAGVISISERIGRLLARVHPGARVTLVGHSLGGLAVRWFVQEGPPDPRVVETITVAAPFEGARGATLFPGQAGRDMARGSAILERLAASARSANVRHLSILGTADTAVSVDTVFPVGDRLVVPGAGHNALLFHDDVAGSILARLRRP